MLAVLAVQGVCRGPVRVKIRPCCGDIFAGSGSWAAVTVTIDLGLRLGCGGFILPALLVKEELFLSNAGTARLLLAIVPRTK